MQIAIAFFRVWVCTEFEFVMGFGLMVSGAFRSVCRRWRPKPKAAQKAHLIRCRKDRLGSTWRRPPAAAETETKRPSLRRSRSQSCSQGLGLGRGLLGIALPASPGARLRAQFRFRFRFELHNESPPPPSPLKKCGSLKSLGPKMHFDMQQPTHTHTWFDFFYRQFLLNSSYFFSALQRFLLSRFFFFCYLILLLCSCTSTNSSRNREHKPKI